MDGEGEDDDDDRLSHTRSEPPPDISGSSEHTVIHTRPVGNQRSASVPPRPMKSALASATPPAKTPDSEHCPRKRARFDDDAIIAELNLRHSPTEPKLVRRCSASDRDDRYRRILLRDSFSEHAQSFYTDDSERKEDEELTTAIELFEEVVEELVQVAEEHAEAHEQLASLAHQVAGAIFNRRQKSEDRADDGVDTESNADKRVCPRWIAAPSGMIRQCSADVDVDESCMEDLTPKSSYSDDDSDEEQFNTEDQTCNRSSSRIVLFADDSTLEPQSLQSIIEEPNSSTETITGQDNAASGPKHRVSDSQAMGLNLTRRDTVRRRASMTDFTKLSGRLRLSPSSPKASPAGCAVTVCSVRAAESPKLNTVYERPGARYGMLEGDRRPTKMAQTVRSDAGTLQVLWIEPTPTSASSDVSLLDSSGQAPELIVSEEDADISRTPSPMDKVKTKLAAWSWAREQGLDEFGGPNWIPLLSCHDDTSCSPSGAPSPRAEEPYAPPNTERPSGASSAKHSAPHSPGPKEFDPIGADDEEEEDHPLELKVKASLARPATSLPPSLQKSQGDYLSLPVKQPQSTPSSPAIKPISRELSNLPIEDTHFKSHKNSLVLLYKRKDEGKMNQQLMNSRDSVILARSKFDSRYPKSALDSKSFWSRHGPLSPILDTSPPDTRVQAGLVGMEKVMEAPERRERKPQVKVVDEAHPDEHANCPICKVERPRWFEANCKKGHFV